MRFNGGGIGHNVQFKARLDVSNETQDMTELQLPELVGTECSVNTEGNTEGGSESEVASESEVESRDRGSDSSENSGENPSLSDVSDDGYRSA